MKEETTKHTLHFYRGDFQRLQELYPELGASMVIRKLVRKHIDAIEAKGQPAPDAISKDLTI